MRQPGKCPRCGARVGVETIEDEQGRRQVYTDLVTHDVHLCRAGIDMEPAP